MKWLIIVKEIVSLSVTWKEDAGQQSLITFIQIAFALNMKPSELMKEFEENTGLLENYHKEDDNSKDT